MANVEPLIKKGTYMVYVSIMVKACNKMKPRVAVMPIEFYTHFFLKEEIEKSLKGVMVNILGKKEKDIYIVGYEILTNEKITEIEKVFNLKKYGHLSIVK